MRLLARVLLVAALGALVAPSAASAGVETLVFRSSPITIKPYGVARDVQGVDSPRVDGNVVGMSADLVDAAGNVVPYTHVMLHHVVFLRAFHADSTCSSFTDYDGKTGGLPAQRFYAEGEEHYSLSLPQGYGYPNRGSDVWALVYMLMNHHNRTETVQVRYTVRYDTSASLIPVTPIWLDVRNCRADPIYSIPGTGGRSSTYSQHYDYRLPSSGYLVAAGAHLHGGGIANELVDTTCGTRLFESVPTWGMIEPKPPMHEPGPMEMTPLSTAPGIPVAGGDVLRLNTIYDNSHPHMRVMGIMIVYLAPGAVTGCPAAPAPARAAAGTPPHMLLPLLKPPQGPVAHVRSTWVGDYAFGTQRVSIPRGTTFEWNFVGSVVHDVTLASGPVGFASADLRRGSYHYRFTRPGTYKLFCSLHPMRMTQVIAVR